MLSLLAWSSLPDNIAHLSLGLEGNSDGGVSSCTSMARMPPRFPRLSPSSLLVQLKYATQHFSSVIFLFFVSQPQCCQLAVHAIPVRLYALRFEAQAWTIP